MPARIDDLLVIGALLTGLAARGASEALIGSLSSFLLEELRRHLAAEVERLAEQRFRSLLASLLTHQASVGASVILLSATLSTGVRERLATAFAAEIGAAPLGRLDRKTYPLVSVFGRGEARQIPVRRRPDHADVPVRVGRLSGAGEAVAQVVEWAAAGRSVVWFRNTVADAIEGHTLVVAAMRAAGISRPLLLHSRFAPPDRLDKEEALLRRLGKRPGADRRGVVLVATQAAEQSLDFDADAMISDLAPVDALLQRLGRRRRPRRDAAGALHVGPDARDPQSPFLIVCPEPAPDADAWYRAAFPRAAHVYEDYAALWLTARLMLQPGLIPERRAGLPADAIIPYEDTRALTEAVYDGDVVRRLAPAALLASHHAAQGAQRAEATQAIRALLPWRRGFLAGWHEAEADLESIEGAPTRLGLNLEVLLLVERGMRLSFLHDGTDPIALSSVRLRQKLSMADCDGPVIEAFRREMPKRLRARFDAVPYRVVLRPEPVSAGLVGIAVAAPEASNVRLVAVRYDSEVGLTVTATRQGH